MLSASGQAASTSGQDLLPKFLYNEPMERRKMAVAAPEWELEVQRGPDWLFVRLKPPRDGLVEAPDLVTPLWGLIEQHFTYRIVLEMWDVDWLPSQLIGQLVVLVKRVHEHGGVLRLCGMSELCEQAIRLCRLSNCLPNYHSRAEAVLGPRPLQPR